MSLNDEVHMLRCIPLFAQVEPAKLKLLAFTSERVAFDADHVLFAQGDPANAAYIIVEGKAEVIVESDAGPVTVAVLGPNDFFGEIAILCDSPRTATVRAQTRLVTLRISKDLFFRLVKEFPQMAVAIMRELAFRLEATNDQLRIAHGEIDRARRQISSVLSPP
jgi:CRP/FNR family cyclic AMP-dependent transcriptional regulator